MSYTPPTDRAIHDLLARARTIAIVGASSNPDRASHGIMQRLQRAGYHVIPVNPNEQEILGEKAYARLADIPSPIDIVDVFRRAEDAPGIAREAVAAGAKALWLQSGIESDEAATIASKAGLFMIMDACLGTAVAVHGGRRRQ